MEPVHQGPRAEVERPLVVVAEDDAELRRLIARTLQRDYRVDEVADGKALLARLVARPTPDLLVTDLRMPWIDGLDAVHRAGVRGHLRILLVTAFPDAVVAERAEHADAQLLAKPFDLDELRAVVARLLHPPDHESEPEHDGYGPIRRRSVA